MVFSRKWFGSIEFRLFISVLLLGLFCFQDYLESYFWDFNYYISESILFNLIWICILPIDIFFKKIYRAYRIHYKTIAFYLVNIGQALVSLLFFSILVSTISVLSAHRGYYFLSVLEYSLSNYFIFVLAISITWNILKQGTAAADMDITQKLPTKKIIAQSITEKIPLDIGSIQSILAATPYVKIHTSDKILSKKTSLQKLMSDLNHPKILRIHKSTIINIDFVESFKSRGNGDYDIIMKNGQSLRLSRSYAKIVLDQIRHSA